jgi:RNA polymerase sigma factor (sigma-70 family)
MPKTTDDWALLESYAQHGSHEAFGKIVAKYADFVLSIARRRVRDVQLAEDVTQSVFIVLARRAGALRGGGSLAAWLHRTTLLAAANAIRSENRRLAREKVAFEIAGNSDAVAVRSDDTLLDLDDALQQISRADRDVLSLHYLEGRPVIVTAQVLGISAEAAKKRLSRALARLRRRLSPGVAETSAALSSALGHIAMSAPGASPIASGNILAGGSDGRAFTLARDVIHIMKTNALKQFAALITVPLVLLAVGVGIVVMMSGPNANPASAQPASSPVSSRPASLPVSSPVPIDIQTGPTPIDVTVVDNDTGNPIANATIAKLVAIGTFRRGMSEVTTQIPMGVTDIHGAIHLICDPAQRTGFLVTASGKAARTFGFWGCVPPTQRVAMNRPAGTLSGRAVDAAGVPIANCPVRVMVEDGDLLPAFFSTDFPQFSYTVDGVTDNSGRFSIPEPEAYAGAVYIKQNGAWLPLALPDAQWSDDPVDCPLRSGTFVGHPLPQAPALAPPPATRPAVAPTMTIRIHVVEADTGLPIQHLHVYSGGSVAPNQRCFTRFHQVIEPPGNELTWSFYDKGWAHFLRVEADGYAAAPTRLVKASEKQADLELKLRKASNVVLKIITPDGHSTAGARAYLATPTVTLNTIAPSQPPWHCEPPIAIAGTDGLLHFSAPAEPYRLAIVHADGWAEVSPTVNSGPVKLTRWAALSLTITPNGRPLANASVEPQSFYSEDLDCWIDWGDTYATDSNGRLSIPQCRSGHCILAITRGMETVGWQYLEAQVDLKPGKRADFPILVGKTNVHGSLTDPAGYEWSTIYIRPAGPAAKLPADVNQLTGKAQDLAVQQAQQHADSNAIEPVITDITLPPAADGTFAMVGLRPATYLIQGFAQPVSGNAHPANGAPVRPPELSWYFSVPVSEPRDLDLGPISAAMPDRPSLRIGQVMPDLTATTLDGTRFFLKDCRGKWVLLDFWGTWCGPCVREEPTLKDAYEGWSRDGRLLIVSASIDDTREQVAREVAAKQLNWTQLVLGDRDKTDVPARFGVEGYPTIMLISPEGKLVESGERGGALRDVLIQNLGAPGP